MDRANHRALRYGWAEEIKRLSEKGDHDGVAELVDMIKGHVDQIGVFDRQWVGIINGATDRAIPVEMTKADALKLFRDQGGLCALTGLSIDFKVDNFQRGRKRYGCASLDRIDTDGPYRLGNVWWVHRDVNQMKGSLSLERLYDLARLVASHEGASAQRARLDAADLLGVPQPLIDLPSPARTTAWFLRSCCEDDPNHYEWSADLWERFEAWRVTADVPPCSQTAFGRALRSLGYECERARYARWYGLRLIPTGVARVETTLAQPARSEFPT